MLHCLLCIFPLRAHLLTGILVFAACQQIVTEALEEYGDDGDENEKAESGAWWTLCAALFLKDLVVFVVLCPCVDALTHANTQQKPSMYRLAYAKPGC